jgi:hypothetical protein
MLDTQHRCLNDVGCMMKIRNAFIKELNYCKRLNRKGIQEVPENSGIVPTDPSKIATETVTEPTFSAPFPINGAGTENVGQLASSSSAQAGIAESSSQAANSFNNHFGNAESPGKVASSSSTPTQVAESSSQVADSSSTQAGIAESSSQAADAAAIPRPLSPFSQQLQDTLLEALRNAENLDVSSIGSYIGF